MAQTNPPNLSAFLSAAQGLASALGPESSSSPTSSSTLSTSTTSPTTSSSTLSTPSTTNSLLSNTASSALAASTSAIGSSASDTSSGIDPRTRNIILGVTIPVGLLLLAALIIGLLLCCRRRRRTRRSPSPESKFTNNKDWEHGDSAHHGYNSNSSLRTGHSNGIGNNFAHDSAPLMHPAHHSQPVMTQHERTPHMFGNHVSHDSAPLMHPAHQSGGVMSHTEQAPHEFEHPALMAASHHTGGRGVSSNHHGVMSTEPPAYQRTNENPNIQNPFTPVPPISRKPVPSRDSTGSNISAISGSHSNNHHSALKTGAVVGAGALAGAAAMHHHDKNRHSDVSQHRPDPVQRPESLHSIHRPLGSHPHEPGTYVTAGPVNNYPYDRRPSTPPFSPDDVGSMHRRSQRFSHVAPEQVSAVPQPQVPDVMTGGIIAPTASQRRSLQSRNSSYSDGRDTSRGPSRSPKRRSLTGGGEMWQADTTPPPALPTQSRHNSGEFNPTIPTAVAMHPSQNRISSGDYPHTGPTAVAASAMRPTQSRHSSGDAPYSAPGNGMASMRPNRSRHNSQESRTSSASASTRQPALPSTRHLGRSQRPHLYEAVDYSNTDSSTSNDSWESAHAELDPWEDRDPGRYPRFSGGSANSRAPLMPTSAAPWDETRERRWSGDIFNRDVSGSHRFSAGAAEPRRNSGGGMDRRRLRFSEGGPEYYNEQGLVGRAL